MTMAQDWHVSEQMLKFQIGDLIFGTMRFKVLACEVGLGNEGSDMSLPPDKVLESDMSGYAIRGLPVTTARPLLEARDGYYIYTPKTFLRHYINMRQSFEDYTKGFRSKTRSTIRRKIRKFSEASGGSIDFRAYRSANEIEEFYRFARKVSADTYQERLLDAGLPDNQEYFTQLRNSAANDGVRGFVLFYEDRPISYLLLRIVEDMLLYDYLGYDPEYAKWSAGTVLHWLAIEDLFAEQRYRLLDFTEGDGEHKRRFGTDHITCANVFCLKKKPSTYFMLHLHAGLDRFAAFSGELLTRLGLRSKIRKWLRR